MSNTLQPIHPDISTVLVQKAMPVVEAYREEVLQQLQMANRTITDLAYISIGSTLKKSLS